MSSTPLRCRRGGRVPGGPGGAGWGLTVSGRNSVLFKRAFSALGRWISTEGPGRRVGALPFWGRPRAPPELGGGRLRRRSPQTMRGLSPSRPQKGRTPTHLLCAPSNMEPAPEGRGRRAHVTNVGLVQLGAGRREPTLLSCISERGFRDVAHYMYAARVACVDVCARQSGRAALRVPINFADPASPPLSSSASAPKGPEGLRAFGSGQAAEAGPPKACKPG